MPKKHSLETHDISGVEIFAVGTWNGDDYTLSDLKDMESNFLELRSGLKPYLKLGHDDGQLLIQSDGMPAAGWVDRLYVVGDKLLADFSQIPKTIYELIKSGGYKKVSSEIFWNLKIGDKVYKKVLAAVALLGADTPAVMNLNDILAMYTKEGKDLRVYLLQDLEIKYINDKEIIKMPTENEIKLEAELKAKTEELDLEKEKIQKLEAEKAQFTKELDEHKAYKAKVEEEKQELLLKAQAAEREKYIQELVAEGLCSPGMKIYVEQLLGEEKKEYSFKANDKDMSLTKEQLLKETLKSFKAIADVNFDESSNAGKGDSKNEVKETEEKIQKYMAEHKVNYSAAYKAILKQTN